MTAATGDAAPDLDPEDWEAFRSIAHRALDGMIDHLQSIREQPVWREPPSITRERFNRDLPAKGRDLAEVVRDFEEHIKPFATGNVHPGFMGWVHGAGTPVGMLAEMLSAGLNANCGGRNHIGLVLEEQIATWMKQAFRFPASATGLHVTGTSMANFLALVVARDAALADNTRRSGLWSQPKLVAYASEAAHVCVAKAVEASGIGTAQLRSVPCDVEGRMRTDLLRSLIAKDEKDGLRPFLIVGTAGSVDIGAFDDLLELADIAAESRLWFHVDGAFGALVVFSPQLAGLAAGIERADSIAFDFHKWAHVPYDAGFLLVKDGKAHEKAFASPRSYLARGETGLSAGSRWPCDLGLDLSRGFRALKTWFTLETFGTDLLGQCMVRNCELASYLADVLNRSGDFAVLAPVRLNIVCFAVVGRESDDESRKLVARMQIAGRAVLSLTKIGGAAAIRCAIVNHRTTMVDIDALVADLRDESRRPSA